MAGFARRSSRRYRSWFAQFYHKLKKRKEDNESERGDFNALDFNSLDFFTGQKSPQDSKILLSNGSISFQDGQGIQTSDGYTMG